MMQTSILKSSSQLIKLTSNDRELTNEVNLNYNKSSIEKANHVTSINIDKAVAGKYEIANTKTYTQNLVKKYELTGNKEVCVRKIFIAQREDSLFDITVRELNIYFRKAKKHHFNKVIRFKSPNGAIEHVLDVLKNKSTQKTFTTQTSYLLN